MNDKVCIQPCNGITTAIGTVVRQAGYKVCEDLKPGITALGCNPALYHDVDEDVFFIQEYPVVAIEGCDERCATKLVEMKGEKVAVTIFAPEVLRQAGIDLEGETREQLGEKGGRAVDAVARAAAEGVDRLLLQKKKAKKEPHRMDPEPKTVQHQRNA